VAVLVNGYVIIESDRPTERIKRPEIQKRVKIDTTDWKTYRNEKYGFEVKYANDWMYKESVADRNDGIGGSICFGERSCLEKSEMTGDCENYTCINIDNDLKRFNKKYEDKSDDPSITNICRSDIPLLNFSETFPGMRACWVDNFGYIWDLYFFIDNKLGYMLTIRHQDPNHNPEIERTILESFKFIEK